MKFGVVIFPGSNCDRDMIHVLRNVLNQDVLELWHKEESLDGFTTEDCIVLPGGFSYGDYLRSGAIARFSPIMAAVIQHAEAGGKVIGICNGFQILCESGLLPGALLRNKEQRFVCKNAFIKPANTNRPMTQGLIDHKSYCIPVAHAEGRYFADASTIQTLEDNGQILFYYATEEGDVTTAANFNGSVDNIAGICNKDGNVLGMMPHPERAAEEILGNTDGRLLLTAYLDYFGVPA